MHTHKYNIYACMHTYAEYSANLLVKGKMLDT